MQSNALLMEIDTGDKKYLKGPVFHYTSVESLFSIINGKNLWATNCEYLNDKHELTYSEIMEKQFKIELAKMNIIGIDEFFNNKFFNTWIHDAKKRTYISSFSIEGDSIGMWNSYGKNGVSIEFDITQLINGLIKNERLPIKTRSGITDNNAIGFRSIGKVIYSEKELNKVINRLFVNIPQNMISNNEVLIQEIYNITTLMALKKEKSFEYEKELRIFYRLVTDYKGDGEQYRVKNGMIIPYVNIQFDSFNLLPIKSIIVSPYQNDEYACDGLKRFMTSYGYDVPIKKSKLGVRD